MVLEKIKIVIHTQKHAYYYLKCKLQQIWENTFLTCDETLAW